MPWWFSKLASRIRSSSDNSVRSRTNKIDGSIRANISSFTSKRSMSGSSVGSARPQLHEQVQDRGMFSSVLNSMIGSLTKAKRQRQRPRSIQTHVLSPTDIKQLHPVVSIRRSSSSSSHSVTHPTVFVRPSKSRSPRSLRTVAFGSLHPIPFNPFMRYHQEECLIYQRAYN